MDSIAEGFVVFCNLSQKSCSLILVDLIESQSTLFINEYRIHIENKLILVRLNEEKRK